MIGVLYAATVLNSCFFAWQRLLRYLSSTVRANANIFESAQDQGCAGVSWAQWRARLQELQLWQVQALIVVRGVINSRYSLAANRGELIPIETGSSFCYSCTCARRALLFLWASLTPSPAQPLISLLLWRTVTTQNRTVIQNYYYNRDEWYFCTWSVNPKYSDYTLNC